MHNLLGRAQRHLEQLVPGFGERFVARGGQRAKAAGQTHVYEFGVQMPERDLGMEIWSSAKSVVDEILDEAVRDAPVRRLLGRRASGLVHDGHQVTGVQVDGQTIAANLVIDAMGAKSPMRAWLSIDVPAEEYVVRQWYATMAFRRPPSYVDVPDFWLTFPTHPRTRGGLVSPVDPVTWHVSLSGGLNDEAPRSVADFLAYARTLEHPAIAELLTQAAPVGVPHVFGKPVAVWRRFEHVPQLPTGLISLGDAIAGLNPLLGQGVSVASAQAHCLSTLLSKGVDLAELTTLFRAEAADVVRQAWDLTTLHEPEPGNITLTDDQCDRIVRVVDAAPAAHSEYVKVWHMLRPPTVLFDLAERELTAAGREPKR